MVKKKGGQLTKYKRDKLLDDLRGLFNSGKIRHYSIRDLSSKFDIAKDTVSKYLDEIRIEIDPADIQVTQIKFKTIFEQAINDCELLVMRAKQDVESGMINRERDVRESIKLLLETIKQQTDFMERFFIKDKVVEKIDLKADITQRSVNIQIIDDRRDIAKLES